MSSDFPRRCSCRALHLCLTGYRGFFLTSLCFLYKLIVFPAEVYSPQKMKTPSLGILIIFVLKVFCCCCCFGFLRGFLLWFPWSINYYCNNPQCHHHQHESEPLCSFYISLTKQYTNQKCPQIFQCQLCTFISMK